MGVQGTHGQAQTRAGMLLRQAARIWRRHAEAALRDPGLDERARLNACYDDGAAADPQPPTDVLLS